MKSNGVENGRGLEDKTFLWLLVLISLAFFWVIRPLYGAVLWALVAAVLFGGMHLRILAAIRRPNLAALASVIAVLVIVILPLAILTTSVLTEASEVYDKIKSGDIDLGGQIQKAFNGMPEWATRWLNRIGLSNFNDLKDRLATSVSKGSQFAIVQAINLGHSTFDFFLNLFVMLYVLFFLFRDGKSLAGNMRNAIPLRHEHKEALFDRFGVVIRATIKGNMVVALLQGGLGGLIFWILGIQGALLWGALMALLSLLPAVGAAMVWLPVAIYLLATGAVGRGIVLLVFGGVVISLVDNLVRPILVGKDTKMPDYIVLVATLGGLAVFGVNGFVLGPLIAAMFISVWEIHGAARATTADSMN
jgi:predicted PurR-regulated permease PerM